MPPKSSKIVKDSSANKKQSKKEYEKEGNLFSASEASAEQSDEQSSSSSTEQPIDNIPNAATPVPVLLAAKDA